VSEASPDREEQLRRLRRWLAVSDRLDRLIEASEQPAGAESAPLFVRPAAEATRTSRGLRASFAARFARLAIALHREAAAEAGLQPRTESPR